MNTTIWKAIIAGYIHLKRFIMPSLYLCVRDIHEKSNESSLRPSDKEKYFQYITIRAKCNVEPKENRSC